MLILIATKYISFKKYLIYPKDNLDEPINKTTWLFEKE